MGGRGQGGRGDTIHTLWQAPSADAGVRGGLVRQGCEFAQRLSPLQCSVFAFCFMASLNSAQQPGMRANSGLGYKRTRSCASPTRISSLGLWTDSAHVLATPER